ncbi:MAG: SDR family oxidoreductase [Bacteroidales bacterium]|nr:SDR family oxidoreductase [Bacteroidales bacterium]
MKKLLVTGASGLLGSNLAHMASDNFEVYATYNTNYVSISGCKCLKLDITNINDVSRIIEAIKPDLIVHCAANTDVDYCEKNHVEAWNQNVKGTANLAHAAEKSNAFMIYISTDSVFDGMRGNYSEDDIPNPINYYAQTKLEGEQVIQKYKIDYLIARTNIYGWNYLNKNSFAEWIMQSLQAHKKITLFNDVYFSPILVNNLIDVLFNLYQKNTRGVYHISGSECCSKLQFGENVADVFNFDTKYIEQISVDEKNLFAQRPKNTSLNVDRASELSDVKLLNVHDGLLKMKQLASVKYVNQLKNIS